MIQKMIEIPKITETGCFIQVPLAFFPKTRVNVSKHRNRLINNVSHVPKLLY